MSENSSALRLSLILETPRGVRVVDVVDPVVVTLATRENAGSRGMDEDYATRRRSGTFGDFGEFDRDLSFASGRFLGRRYLRLRAGGQGGFGGYI